MRTLYTRSRAINIKDVYLLRLELPNYSIVARSKKKKDNTAEEKKLKMKEDAHPIE